MVVEEEEEEVEEEEVRPLLLISCHTSPLLKPLLSCLPFTLTLTGAVN